MSIRKIIITLVTALMAVFLYQPSVFAHPGRTASDGCHYCRTNCDKWGVPWNERHCHGGRVDLPSNAKVGCDDNLWTLLAPGKQSCKYTFGDFATGWGLIYGGVIFIIYSYFKQKQ